MYTKNWWPGKRVLVASSWVAGVDWHESSISVDLKRDTIKAAPEFDASAPIARDYETRLFEHYARTPYWGERRLAA